MLKTSVIILAVIVICLALCFALTLPPIPSPILKPAISDNTAEIKPASYPPVPRTTRETEYVFIELPPEVREVTKEVIKQPRLSDWSSLEEIQTFLKEHGDERMVELIAGESGRIGLSGICVPSTQSLRDLAEKYGKNIEIQALRPLDYYQVFKRSVKSSHAVAAAYTDTDVYFIEPANLEIKWAYKVGG